MLVLECERSGRGGGRWVSWARSGSFLVRSSRGAREADVGQELKPKDACERAGMRRGGGLIEEEVSNMAGKMGDTAARVVGCRKLEDVVGRGVVRGSDVVCGEVGGEVDLGTLFGLAGTVGIAQQALLKMGAVPVQSPGQGR